MKIILILLLSLNIYAQALESFSKAKKLMKEVYKPHQIAFYSDCTYSYKDKKNMIDRNSCGYTPRHERTKKNNINKRARRIEWEHVMPAQNFGQHFTCWRDGDSKCVSNKGKTYKGRRCCQKVSQKYRIMQADLMNLVPAIGELNADRSNYRYSTEAPTLGQYGKVKFLVSFKQKRALINPSKRGDVARIYLYMHKKYNIPLSKQEKQTMSAWDKMDPIDTWEKQRLNKIYYIQKNVYADNLASISHFD